MKIADINVAALNHSLFRYPDLWNEHRFRTTFPNTPHLEVDDIWIRFSSLENCVHTSRVIGDGEPVWYPPVIKLPELKPMVLSLMNMVGATHLDRLLITRLKPGGHIKSHADNDGSYVHDPNRMRYHIVLQGFPGSLYRTGDETVNMLTGEIWAFNALIEHEVMNNSSEDRIHLLVDLTIWPTEVL